MRTRGILALLALLVALLAASAGAGATAEQDPVSRLAERVLRLRSGRLTFDAKVASELRDLAADARLIWAVDSGREREVAPVLLDVMGAFLDAHGPAPLGQAAADLRDQAQETLSAHLDSRFAVALGREIVPVATQPLERRLAAIRLLREQTQPAVLLALLSCSQEREPRLRHEALTNLAGWHDPAVHATFLKELQRELAGDPAAEGVLAERHFSQVASDPQKRFLPELEPIVKTGLVSSDWRTAARAAALSRPFANEAILPHLIEALNLWKTRGPAFGHSLRMQLEIERELRQRSGRSLGLDPETWRKWWAATRRGDLPRTGAAGQAVPVELTKGSFFGLKPGSDRIVFVLDRSQSMDGPFGADAASGGFRRRWDEAVLQLLGFLEALGPESRFDVVVFHDYALSWKNGELVPADAGHRRQLQEWLAAQIPNGGTMLRQGIEAALQLDPSGRLQLQKLQADTVVVLCDGETAEGPGWVRRFLDEVNSAARIVFYGVQVGGKGDGTLEALAGGSAGEFAHIPG
jgi:hypothetical protein